MFTAMLVCNVIFVPPLLPVVSILHFEREDAKSSRSKMCSLSFKIDVLCR
jgi:hypothetical protein